jgi:hypothetical protein
MCDPQNLLGGAGGGTAGLDYEIAVLANPADLTQPVIVVNNFNPLTGVYTPTFRNVDGTVYTGATPVNVTGSTASVESIAGCDVNNHTAIWDTGGEGVAGSVFSFNVLDGVGTTENIASVKVYVTTPVLELKIVQTDVAAPFTFAIDTASLPDGAYEVYTEVTYSSGNVFIDRSHDISVTAGVPSVLTTYLPNGAHVSGGTRTYSEKIDEALLIFDSTGALTATLALPLTAVPTAYTLVGNDFQLSCPDPTVEKLEFTTASTPASYIREVCMIDDTLNDGTVLVPFVRLRVVSSEDGSLLNTFNKTSDLSSDYAIVGTAAECCDTGAASTLVPRRTHLVGANVFTLPVTAQSVTLKVRAVGNIANPPTVNDGTSVTPLFAGDVETWGAQDSTYFLLSGTLDITMAESGDVITILWTEVK